eukprot:7555419-Karenia_brevis.AAC.1
MRQFIPGEIVFRRMPPKARVPKHLLGVPSMGPYVVATQNTFSSVVLKDPATGVMVDKGTDIPLEQIRAGPRRGQLLFEQSSANRSIGQMMNGTDSDAPHEVKATGWKPGKKKGLKGLVKGLYIAYGPDTSRELSIAFVLYNDKNQQRVEAQSCRSVWTGTAVQHVKEYRKSDAEGSEIFLEPTEEPVKIVVFYRAIVKLVELYVDGRLMQGD